MAVNLHQTCWRFGYDDGTESTHTFRAAENAAALLPLDTNILLRLGIQQTEATAAANLAQQFQYNRNGAGWNDITTASSVARAVAVASFANGDTSTKRLTTLTGSGDTSNANCTEDGSSGGNNNDVPASGFSETVLGFQLRSADVAQGDSIQFRVTVSGPSTTITYDVTPIAYVPVDRTPTTGGLTATGQQPSQDTGITAVVGELVAAGVAGFLALGIAASPGALEATGYPPTVTVGEPPVSITPATGRLVLGVEHAATPSWDQLLLIGNAPRLDIAITPPPGSLAAVGYEPTVIDSGAGSSTVTPAAGALALVGYPPVVPVSITPAVGSLALTTYPPPLGDLVDLTPTTGTIAAAGYAPVQVFGFIIVPPTGALATNTLASRLDTGIVPGVGALRLGLGVVITPDSGSLAATGLAPTVLGEQSPVRVPGTGVLSLGGYDPSVLAGHTITPSTGSLVAVGNQVIRDESPTITPSTGSLVGTGLAPGLSRDTVAVPSTASLTATGYSPETGAGHDITPLTGALRLGMLVSVTKQPPPGGLGLVGYAPSVLTPPSITPTPGTLGVAGYAPFVYPTVDIYRDIIQWSAPTSGGFPTEYRVKTSAIQGGPYTTTEVIIPPLTQCSVFAAVDGIPGLYFCVVTAWNTGGESPVSNEIVFYASADLDYTVIPGTGTLTAAGLAPVVGGMHFCTPQPGTVAASGLSPTVSESTPSTPPPATGSLAIIGNASRLDAGVTPPAASLGIVGNAPLVASTRWIVPETAALGLATHPPFSNVGRDITPATGQLTLGGYAPFSPVSITPQTGSLTMAGQTVEVPGKAVDGTRRRRRS